MADTRDFLAEKNWEEEIQPFLLFEKLFFALFGVTGPSDIMISKYLQAWTWYGFKLVFASYLLLTVIVLINLLIAMMSDTYCRIQEQSDIEWKFGLAKLIRNMQRTQVAPSPLNLVTTWCVLIRQKYRDVKLIAVVLLIDMIILVWKRNYFYLIISRN